jgi:hypothetical protein
MAKEISEAMNGHDDERRSDPSNQSGGNATALLVKIQRQLSHLERKMDNMISLLQERNSRGNSSLERSFHKKPPSRASQVPGRFDSRKFQKRNEKSGEEDAGLKFYSRFTKQNGQSGHRKRTFQRKPQKKT